MKAKFRYAKINSPKLVSMDNKIVVLLQDKVIRKGWTMVKLVDEYKIDYGFPFMVQSKYLEFFEFIHHRTEDDLSEDDFKYLTEF